MSRCSSPSHARVRATGKVYAEAADRGDGYAFDFKHRFWQASLDHYAIYGVDELESANTYRTPQFAEQFGSFQTIAREYGGAVRLREDLLAVKHHLYVAMTV
jgi:hypothetical protein